LSQYPSTQLAALLNSKRSAQHIRFITSLTLAPPRALLNKKARDSLEIACKLKKERKKNFARDSQMRHQSQAEQIQIKKKRNRTEREDGLSGANIARFGLVNDAIIPDMHITSLMGSRGQRHARTESRLRQRFRSHVS